MARWLASILPSLFPSTTASWATARGKASQLSLHWRNPGLFLWQGGCGQGYLCRRLLCGGRTNEFHIVKGDWGRNGKHQERKALRFLGDQLDSEALLEVCREPGFSTHTAGKKGEEYSTTLWHWRLNYTTEVTVEVCVYVMCIYKGAQYSTPNCLGILKSRAM